MLRHGDTIAAPATAPGGALALIRISGPDALELCDRCFTSPSGKLLRHQRGGTVHYGNLADSEGNFIDEVLVTVFRAPASYTGENMAEISCHGSRWIIAEILRTLNRYGARTAEAGEFTVRAFLAGKLDLAQAEAVADMIAAGNRASHALASTQLRGHYSAALSALRGELLQLASLLELELDFSEEDVTFADRTALQELLDRATNDIAELADSFLLGNAIREGIPVAITGSPNVGKSTLLNRLLGEERALVSDIAGTTRDIITENISLDGIGFRFIDTAGIRESNDVLERMGIERTYKVLSEARIILYITEPKEFGSTSMRAAIDAIGLHDGQRLAIVVNKCDSEKPSAFADPQIQSLYPWPVFGISAKYGYHIDTVKRFLTGCIDTEGLYNGASIVSNTRHYEALRMAAEALDDTRRGLDSDLPTDLIAADLRRSLDALGTITGEITTSDLLGEIFSKFCIGK